jgi:hypothetical protein
VALVCIAIYYEFWVVKWDAILGLGIIVGGIHIFYAIGGNKGSLLVLVGVIINAFTAYIHSNKISISKWFNHNDIGHIMLILGFYFMAKGAIKLQEKCNQLVLEKIVILFIFGISFLEASSQHSKDSVQIRKIFDVALADGRSYENLRVLCKNVGNRISGSKAADSAVNWGYNLLKSMWVDTVYKCQLVYHVGAEEL